MKLSSTHLLVHTYTFLFLLSICLGVELLSHQLHFTFGRASFPSAFISLYCHPQCMMVGELILSRNTLKFNISQISISVSVSLK